MPRASLFEAVEAAQLPKHVFRVCQDHIAVFGLGIGRRRLPAEQAVNSLDAVDDRDPLCIDTGIEVSEIRGLLRRMIIAPSRKTSGHPSPVAS